MKRVLITVTGALLVLAAGKAGAVDRVVGPGGTYGDIASAVAAAAGGDTIVLNDGTYTGASNRNITVSKLLTIRSANGAAAATIDLQSSGRAFVFTSGASGSTVRGLTIANGNAPAGTYPEGYGGAIRADASSLTILDSVFTNNRTDRSGGAVAATQLAGALTIRGCRFTGNRALNASGGALALMNGGPNVIEASVFETNLGYLNGGAAYTYATTTLRSCLLRANEALNGNGGGVAYDSATGGGQVVNCTVVNNRASMYGGGLYASFSDAPTLSVDNGIFWGNTASFAGAQIRANSGQLPVTYSVFQNGAAGISSGGATVTYGATNLSTDPSFVSASDFHLQATSTCRDSGTGTPAGGLSTLDVEGNARVQNGTVDRGAYEYPAQALIQLSAASFQFFGLAGGASPPDQTLGVSNAGVGTLAWSASSSCAWLGLSPASGSATTETDPVTMHVDLAGLARGTYSCDVTVTDAAAGNSPQVAVVALAVGGVIAVPGDHPTIQAAVDAATTGDHVVVGDGTWTGAGNKDVLVEKPITIRSAGGAAATVVDCEGSGRGFVFSGASSRGAVLEGFTVRNGSPADRGPTGGAVYAKDTTLTLRDCRFLENAVAAGMGGAVYAEDTNLAVEGCVVRGNEALATGGVHVVGVDPLDAAGSTLADSVFEGNVSTLAGGGGATLVGTAAVRRCVFRGNTTAAKGGGLLVGNAAVAVSDSLFTGGQAGQAGGGVAFQSDAATASVVNCTLAGNTGGVGGGGGIHHAFVNVSGGSGSTLKVFNAVLWGNAAAGSPQQITVDGAGATLVVDYSDLQGGQAAAGALNGATLTWGAANLDADPRFVSAADHHVAGDSPCVDAGTGDAGVLGAPLAAVDLAGGPRVVGAEVDLGAYEYSVPTTPLVGLSAVSFAFAAVEGGANPADRTLTITNPGIGTLAWSVGEGCPWLEAVPASGETTTEADEVVLRVDATGLARGSYACDLAISDPAAANSPQAVSASLAVAGLLWVPDGFATIQAAIDAAVPGEVVVVRDGTWAGPGNVDLDLGGKAITVRSENGAASTVIDAGGAARGFVFASGETAASVVRGFTIRNGRVTGNGGAVFVDALCSPTIEECVFEGNVALADPADPTLTDSGIGGAVYLGAYSAATLRGCVFTGNTAYRDGGALGLSYAHPLVTGCEFEGNKALYAADNAGLGGAVFAYEAAGTLFERTSFRSNTAVRSGGAVHLDSTGTPAGAVTFTGCSFTGCSALDGGAVGNAGGLTVSVNSSFFDANVAERDGGALHLARDAGAAAAVNVTNCTFTGNRAGRDGGAIRNGPFTTLAVVNSILWGNDAAGAGDQLYNHSDVDAGQPAGARVSMGYSDLEQGLAGVGNAGLGSVGLAGPMLDRDPKLVLAGAPDLTAVSPCIDAGTNAPAAGLPAADLGGAPRVSPSGGRVDMGAAEYAGTAGGPTLAVAPRAFDLTLASADAGPLELTLSLRNGGAGTLAWAVAAGCSWIAPSPVSGASSGEVDAVTLGVDAASLLRGVANSCVVTVSDAAGAVAAVTVPVTVRLTREIFVSTWFDPGRDDFRTIQEAIDAAGEGDTVTVRAGTYTGPGNVDLDYHGKAVTVRSEGGPEYTVVDCEGSARGFWFHNGEGPDSVLEGIGIANGETPGNGGGILCEYSSPTIRGCRLIANHAAGSGGGISVANAFRTVVVDKTHFEGNAADGSGGGLVSERSALELTETSFLNNQAGFGGAIADYGSTFRLSRSYLRENYAAGSGGAFRGSVSGTGASVLRAVNNVFAGNVAADEGGAVWLEAGAGSDSARYTATLANNDLFQNQAGYGGALFIRRNNGVDSRHTLTNNIFWNNGALAGGADVYVANDAYVDMSACLLSSAGGYSNGGLDINASNAQCANEGNITGSPGFVSPWTLDLRLRETSPCVDAGRAVDGVYSDYRGSVRPLDGDGDGTSAFDIGAYEYSRHFGGDQDAVARPFQDLEVAGRRVIIGYEYKVLWKDRPPFPGSDQRVSEAGRYRVRLALVTDGGRRVDLTTVEKTLQLAGVSYSIPFTFGPQHVGTWRLRLEMADDPGQYVLSDGTVVVEYRSVTEHVIGREIAPPPEALAGLSPDVEQGDLCYWSNTHQKLYAVAPGVTLITWYADQAKQYPIPILAGNVWPPDTTLHVVGTPAVELLPDGSPYDAVSMKYSGVNAVLPGSSFRMPEEGYSVLQFNHTITKAEKFLVVRSLAWDHAGIPGDPAFPAEETWNIGQPIAGPPGHEPQCGGGYVLDFPAPYDGSGDDRAYDAATRRGPIIPVNLTRAGTADDLVVVWYGRDADGICWPDTPVRYDPRWPDQPRDPLVPADADRPVTPPAEMKTIVVDTEAGSGPLDAAAYGDAASRRVYDQPDPGAAGYNPNEEHALLAPTRSGSGQVLYALRNDLNRDGSSRPYALLKHRDPETGAWAIEVFRVVADVDTGEPGYRPFTRQALSGSLLPVPWPLPAVAAVPCEGTGPTPASGPSYRDKNGALYALEPVPANPVAIRYSYPLPAGFSYDPDGDGDQDAAPGECVPWRLVLDGAAAAAPVEVLYAVAWPDIPAALQVGETLVTAKHGLPEIDGQCSARLLHGESLARLIDPLAPYTAPLAWLPPQAGPSSLPAHLSRRLSYAEADGTLSFSGHYDDSSTGEPLLLPNLMSARDRDFLLGLSAVVDYRGAVTALYDAGRATLAGQADRPELVSGTAAAKALTAGAAAGEGNLLVVFNDNAACTGPVGMAALRVACPPYRGELKVIEPADVFDNRVTLRHSGDFGGSPDGVEFEWRWWEDTDDRPADVASWKPWFADPADGQGAAEIVLEGDGETTLADKWFVVRYRLPGAPCPDAWSEWTAPQLYQGWIKRVLAAVNLFDQRFKDFHASGVNTTASMIMQAGERWEGDAALGTGDLDRLGLIEFYQTLLDRGRALTIDAVVPTWTEASNQQLLLAASRLADLYVLLGNEAYADAVDPTIGFSTEDGGVGSAATSLFCFRNQVASLLDEELALLRGVDRVGLRPYYNRLVWNFTQTEGEVAYVQNYSILDLNGDGFVNEHDARGYFPQGHGDAWGHYLTAVNAYYGLLLHPRYDWKPRAESLLVAGNPVLVDYEDERRFARVAAAKARAGADIVGLTFRQRFGGDAAQRLGGYKDANATRAWGVDEWSGRAGEGAFLDWVAGNAIVPARDDAHEGIEKVDRTTVTELGELPERFLEIQAAQDKADAGFNPLGLARDVVPFDFDPGTDPGGAGIQGQTYFEQIYERALGTVDNAVTVFDLANRSTQLLRRQQDTLGDFQVTVSAAERDFDNRLIEIYGYPYPEDCGPGGTYPPGYCGAGPDLFHFNYVDATELTGMVTGEEPFTVAVDIEDLGVARFDAYRVFSSAEGVWMPEGGIGEWTPYVSQVVFERAPSDSALGFLTKPLSWSGRRKAPGSIQVALSDLVRARADYLAGVAGYRALIDDIEDGANLIRTQWNVDARSLELMTEEKETLATLNSFIVQAHGVKLAFDLVGDLVKDSMDAIAEGLPDSGFDIPPAKLIKAGVKLFGAVFKGIVKVASGVSELKEMMLNMTKEGVSLEAAIDTTRLQNRMAFKQQLAALEGLIRQERAARLQVFSMAEAVDQSLGNYNAAVASGERVLAERYAFRKLTAAEIQGYRYRDMAFRVFRNDALQKYRAQLDMAAFYTYLAAKAYDYDTALLDADSRAGSAFLADIVRERTIGRVEGGEPYVGSGLADSLKRLKLNYQVFKTQMGLNNPQYESNRLSLRGELFRILPGPSSDARWRQALERHRVDDLWAVPEFRRYCRPFAPEGVPQPGIVIPFDTNLTAGLNAFGWPLGPGDSAYSAANFATRIWSAGLWFTDYGQAALGATPRVYLVPVGTDVQRSPTGSDGSLRSWKVVDQRVPLPYPVAADELDGDDGWIPMVDTLREEFFGVRRHGDFRAYHDGGFLDESEMTHDTRLVGRSVWNTRWLLIVPGQNLLHDAAEGVERFINGPQLVGGQGERTGAGVSDIKLHFRTYSYMGN